MPGFMSVSCKYYTQKGGTMQQIPEKFTLPQQKTGLAKQICRGIMIDRGRSVFTDGNKEKRGMQNEKSDRMDFGFDLVPVYVRLRQESR
jgi:hypothetical protein